MYEENKKLCEEMPFLIPRNRWTGEIVEDYDYSWTEIDGEIPEGWRNMVLDMFREITPLLKKANYLEKFRILQLKEKWGCIRLYTNGIPKEIFDDFNKIIQKYEKLSAHTCYRCGDTNAKMTDNGYMIPCCKKCWEED